MDLAELEAKLQELRIESGKISQAIARSDDRNERLRLMNQAKSTEAQLNRVFGQIDRIKSAERLKQQQAERDAMANRQNNGTGKSRNRQRDIF